MMSQELVTSIDSTSIFIGQEITYKLEIHSETLAQIKFPESESFTPMEVLKTYDSDTIISNEKYIVSKKYGLMVNSGSSALILALKVMNFKKGSEIITPSLNFGTAVSSIMLNNLNPILVDCKIDTLQIDPNKIEKKISKKTKAILVPNLIGNIPDWEKIRKIANKYKLMIIED